MEIHFDKKDEHPMCNTSHSDKVFTTKFWNLVSCKKCLKLNKPKQ